MIPIRLEFSGLASYQNRVSIDFSTLISGKLFGIFGPVGSGKSAILDAMSYVLYGETDRLGSKGSAYNLMNLQSQAMEIEFEFQVESNRYLFIYKIKRNKKDFEKLGKGERNAYRMEGGEWVPLEDTGTGLAERILGMKYANFRRTVIIPQGKFQELLHISGTERTQMLQELFQLRRYDLIDGVQQKIQENDTEVVRLETRLQSFGAISKDELAQKRVSHKEKLQELEVVKKQLEVARKDDLLLGSITTNTQELQRVTTELAQRKAQLEKGRRELQDMDIRFKEVVSLVAQHPQQENTLRELQRCLAWKREETQFQRLQQEVQSVTSQVDQQKQQDHLLAQNIKGSEDKQHELESHILSTETFMAMAKWFQEDKQLSRQLQQEEIVVEQLSIEEQHLFQRWMDQDLCKDGVFDKTQKDLEEERKAVQAKLHKASVDHTLHELTQQLVEGDPCPVCGSLEHPIKDSSFAEGSKARSLLEMDMVTLDNQLRTLGVSYKIQQVKREKESHLSQYVWQSICANDQAAFEQLSANQKRYEYQYKELQKSVSALRKERDELQKTLGRLQERLGRITSQIAEMEGKMKTLDKELVSTYEKGSYDDIEKSIEQLSQALQKEKQEESQLRAKREAHSAGIAKVEGFIEEQQRSEERLQETLTQHQENLQRVLLLYKLPSLADWVEGELVEPIQEEYEDLFAEVRDLEKDIIGWERVLQESVTVQKELAEREERGSGLRCLQKLFRAKGFVNFVSHRYLVELCSRANDRFTAFSHNAMRLELQPESGEIMVRDHYNNGRLRSVKTLSGGQTFQASFSFALAMVEMVGQGKENFFFLDEGFGTLDQDSLATVFQTLQSMYKERKIVGLISHVESLKEEIPVYLEVSSHANGGSKVDMVVR